MKTKFNILCGLMVLAIIGAMTTIGGAIGKEDVDDAYAAAAAAQKDWEKTTIPQRVELFENLLGTVFCLTVF